MKLNLNYIQSFQLGNTVSETTIYSNIVPEILDKATSKKSVITRTKRFLYKLSPLHWYDGVWEDLNFDV